MIHTDRVIIRLPCGQGQLSRIWKVQCDWLSMGKECCLRLSTRLWGGMKNKLPQKRLRGRLGGKQSHPVPCMEDDKLKVFWVIPWHLEEKIEWNICMHLDTLS